MKNNKIFLVFNTAAFGDVLLCNSLCQNIRINFPEAKIIFITDKSFVDVAKYQEAVDEVISYDKKGIHIGIKGMFKFVRNFPYKQPYCAFITYKNERNFVISLLLRAKNIITPKKLYYANVQLAHTLLLNKLKGTTVKNLPIRYNVPESMLNHVKSIINIPEKYIVLCALSKNPEKDMPLETAIELIHRINSTSFKTIFVGAGSKAETFADALLKAGCKFVNLVNKTSIPELGAVLKKSTCLISVDTGTMHLGCAVACPVIALFYRTNTVPIWAPNPELYSAKVISDNFSAENIFKCALDIIEGEKNESAISI